MRTLTLAVVVLLAACSDKGAPPPNIDSPKQPAVATLSAEGVGKVTFGATLAEVEHALKEQPIEPVAKDVECTTVQFASLPHLYFMVERGVVVRADAREGAPNITGIGIGDAPDQLVARYKKLVVGPHKYLERGHYLTLPGKHDTAMVFEDNGSKITAVRAGKQPAVAYVEGCS